MPRDLLGASLWTAGKQSDNLGGHPRLQRDVFRLTPQPLAFAALQPSVLVSETLLLGELERLRLNRMPCRSYRFRDRLNLTTTADNVLALLARRLSAASPAGRKIR